MDKRVIRGIYLYEFKLGTTAKEADEKVNAAFGQGCSTIRTAYRWYQKFRNGDESLEGHEGRGRHSDVGEDKLRDVPNICALVREQLGGHLSTSLLFAFGEVMGNPLCQLVQLTQLMWVPGDGGVVHTQVLRKFTSSSPWVRFHQLSQSVVVDIGSTS
ncbi:unnamed protein product [Heligmosomoides polygyrus]|uniref:HTH_48 domain-containing protein n=1 Tax=Heligmosomoides polygyrus TaxID=6339 RepID=A0A183FEZ4_HELPZ|nr:unnamed protein product [Heligmosomoides polygyrus]